MCWQMANGATRFGSMAHRYDVSQQLLSLPYTAVPAYQARKIRFISVPWTIPWIHLGDRPRYGPVSVGAVRHRRITVTVHIPTLISVGKIEPNTHVTTNMHDNTVFDECLLDPISPKPSTIISVSSIMQENGSVLQVSMFCHIRLHCSAILRLLIVTFSDGF